MKKIILITLAILLTVGLQAQVSDTNTRIKHVSSRPDAPRPVYKSVTIDTNTKVVLPKEVVNDLKEESVKKDSTLKAKNDTIAAKSEKNKEIKENSIPVGTGKGYWLIAIIGGILLIGFVLTRFGHNWSKYITVKEIDLIKSVKTVIYTSILTSLMGCINSGGIPQDWNTWKMILMASLTTGIAYLINKVITPTKKAQKTETPKDVNIINQTN